MAHFAEIDADNKVVRVIVADTKEWCEENLGGTWIQTSYNTYGGKHSKPRRKPLRKNFAGIGFTYDKKLDAFIPPKPEEFPDWVLNENTCLWGPAEDAETELPTENLEEETTSEE